MMFSVPTVRNIKINKRERESSKDFFLLTCVQLHFQNGVSAYRFISQEKQAQLKGTITVTFKVIK